MKLCCVYVPRPEPGPVDGSIWREIGPQYMEISLVTVQGGQQLEGVSRLRNTPQRCCPDRDWSSRNGDSMVPLKGILRPLAKL